MTDAVWIAIIVAGGALLTTWLNSRALSRSKREDYARQDVVAERAAHAAKLLLEHDEEQTRLAAVNAADVVGRLSQIHTLVNSNMTAAMESELVALKAQLAMMRRFTDGDTSGIGDQATMTELIRRIGELDAQLVDRARATEAGEREHQAPLT